MVIEVVCRDEEMVRWEKGEDEEKGSNSEVDDVGMNSD